MLPTARRSRCCATKGSARFSRKAAVERLAEKIATAGTQAVLRSRVPFRTIAAQWEASIVPMYKPSTQKNHRHIVHKHLLPRFGGTPIVDMTPQAIQEYIASLIEAGYAPKTIDHIHDVCSAVLRTAVKWGHLRENPAHKVDLPRLRTVRPKCALTIAQARALVEALAPRPPLADPAWQLVEQWRRRTALTGGDALVFATVSGKPIAPNNVLRQWVFPTCTRLQLPRVTWLTCRRTYSSWAHEKGVPGKVVAQLMGHAKVDTTLNVYTQVFDGAAREAAATVGVELFTIVHKTPDSGEQPIE